MFKYYIGLKTLLKDDLSRPKLHGKLVLAKLTFSLQTFVTHFKNLGYRMDILRQTACMVAMADNFVSLFTEFTNHS